MATRGDEPTEHGHRRIVEMDEVGAQAAPGTLERDRRLRHPGRVASDDRQREPALEVARQLARPGGHAHDVTGTLGAGRQGDHDPFGAAHSQLLDRVQDPGYDCLLVRISSSYRPTTRFATTLDSNCSATRLAPAVPRSARSDGSLARVSRASARPSRSPGSTRSPVERSATSSGTPPTRVATTGSAQAIASRIDIGRFSDREVSANTSRSPSRSGASTT